MSRRRVTLLLASIISLAAGSSLYLMYRPTSLVMFHWTDSVGLHSAVVAIRAYALPVPAWITDSLPFALYVVSYMCGMGSLWGKPSIQSFVWTLIVPVVAISSEIAQAAGACPGTYDRLDLAMLVGASALVSAFLVPRTIH